LLVTGPVWAKGQLSPFRQEPLAKKEQVILDRLSAFVREGEDLMGTEDGTNSSAATLRPFCPEVGGTE
jgi:hypothetical protein